MHHQLLFITNVYNGTAWYLLLLIMNKLHCFGVLLNAREYMNIKYFHSCF